MRQLLYTTFTSNNRTSFHLWWKENFIKRQKVSNENDCGWWDASLTLWDLAVSNLYATYTTVVIPIAPPPPPLPPEARPGYTLTHLSVTNSSVSTLLSMSQVTKSKMHWSPQAILLISCSNFKLLNHTIFTLNQSAITNSRHSHTPLYF